MADNIQSFKVVCQGGLDATQNHLLLSEEKPGVATRLVNYEPSLYGGYRRIDGYAEYGPAPYVGGDDAEGPVLGLAIFYNNNNLQSEIIASRKDRSYSFTVATAAQSNFSGVDDNGRSLTITNPSNIRVYIDGYVQFTSAYTIVGNTVSLTSPASLGQVVVIDNCAYSFYRYVNFVGWQKMTTGLIHNTVTPLDDRTIRRVRHAKFNFGAGNKICFVDGINNAVVYNGLTWKYLSPANTGGSSSPGGLNVPERPEIVKAFENYLFLGGDQTDATAISHSDTRDESNFNPSTNSNIIRVGFDVIQFAPFRSDLFIFGRNEIKKLTPDDTLIFKVEPVTANVGCVARDSVIEIGGDLVFLAPDGLRPVAGTSRIGDVEIQTISKPIQTLLSILGQEYDLDELVPVVIKNKSQLRYFISGPNDPATNSLGIIGGLRTADQQLGWEFGEILGISANCATSDFINGAELVLHGDYEGRVFQQETGSNFAGDPILAVYSTPFYDFGDTEVRKNIRRINTFIRAEGPLEMFLGVTYDWFAINVSNPQSYVEEVSGRPVQYRGDNVDYGGVGILYGGSDKPILNTSVEGSGFSARISYVTSGDFAPYTIQGIVIEYTNSGRR